MIRKSIMNAYKRALKFIKIKRFNSADYWQKRYLIGRNSGAGSYSRLAQFKADIINEFVENHSIKTVIEWGCGDGNQLKLAKYPEYIGLDVAQEAINICIAKFKDDHTKKFIWSGSKDFKLENRADLALSLDVLYHLVEDKIFDKYMRQLFDSSNKFVCIYSCNDNYNKNRKEHVKHRTFTDWIDKNCGESWKLIHFVKNKYPYDVNDINNTSWSDFYFYKKN